MYAASLGRWLSKPNILLTPKRKADGPQKWNFPVYSDFEEHLENLPFSLACCSGTRWLHLCAGALVSEEDLEPESMSVFWMEEAVVGRVGRGEEVEKGTSQVMGVAFK